jgi:lipoprotein-anchoring transpeptidase ErfK/SrfK
MTMAKNESLGRIVMLLCCGTAILSLAVHWRITTSDAWQSKDITLANSPRKKPEGVSGVRVLGASAPINKSKQMQLNQRKTVAKTVTLPGQKLVASQPKSSSKELNISSGTQGKQYANKSMEAPNRISLVAPAQPQPNTLIPEAVAQEKKINKPGSEKPQVVVDLSDRRAYVYHSSEVIASYPIAIGKKGWETPTGSFQVKHMQHHPIWRHPITEQVFEPGTDSPLGDRWIGFWTDGRNLNQIGFHGTPDTEVMGTAISHGCLRMRNPDVRLLYEQVGVGTTVVVRE